MDAHHPAENHFGPVVVLQGAAQVEGDQQVVGNLGVVHANGVLLPVDGHLQVVVRVGELAGGGAHRGQPLQHFIPDRIGGRLLLRQLPGLGKGLAGGFVVPFEVAGVSGIEERLDFDRGLLRRADAGAEQDHKESLHGAFLVLIY